MEKNYKREKINPIDFMKKYGINKDISHIKFNPNLKNSESDFFRVKGSKHDGTMFFTFENIGNLLGVLILQESFSKKNPPDSNKDLISINYEIGYIKIATIFGQFNGFFGQRERCRINVKCEYVYGSKEHNAVIIWH